MENSMVASTLVFAAEVMLWAGRLALPAALIKYLIEVFHNEDRYFTLRYYLYQGGAATFVLILPSLLANYVFWITKDYFSVPVYVGTEKDILLALFGYAVSCICSCLSRRSLAKYMQTARRTVN